MKNKKKSSSRISKILINSQEVPTDNVITNRHMESLNKIPRDTTQYID